MRAASPRRPSPPEPSPETRVASPSQRIAALAVTTPAVAPSIEDGRRARAKPRHHRGVALAPIRSPVIPGMTRVGAKRRLASRSECVAGMARVRRVLLAGGGTTLVFGDRRQHVARPARGDGLQGRCRARLRRPDGGVGDRAHFSPPSPTSTANVPHKVLRPLDRVGPSPATERASGKIAPGRGEAPVPHRAAPRLPLSPNVGHRDCFRGRAPGSDVFAAAPDAARPRGRPLRSCPSPRSPACASVSS